jgi:hypothetical protein
MRRRLVFELLCIFFCAYTLSTPISCNRSFFTAPFLCFVGTPLFIHPIALGPSICRHLSALSALSSVLSDQRTKVGRHALDAAADQVALDLARTAWAGERHHLPRVDVARQTKGNVGRDALRDGDETGEGVRHSE